MVMELDQVAGGSLVCCLLCRGMIKDGFKDGNIDRFRYHMYNEHAVIYDIEYMLASSLMDRAMVEEVSSSIRQTRAAALLEENENTMKMGEETLKEASNVSEDNIKELIVEKMKTVEETRTVVDPKAVDETNQCPTCFTHFVAKTMFLHHLRKGCKKEAASKILECKDCPKTYNSKPGLKMHVEKKHAIKAGVESLEKTNIKKEVEYESSDMNVSMDESMYESSHESFKSSDNIEEGEVDMDKSVVDDENKEDNRTGKVSVKSHVCSLCRKGQSTRANFKLHLGRKHPEQLVTNEFLGSCEVTDQGTLVGKLNAFPCNMCTKGYSNKGRLRQHQSKDHGCVTMKGTRGRPPVELNGNFGQEENNILNIPVVTNIEDLQSGEADARSRVEELERIKAEYYGVSNEGGTEASTSNLNTSELLGGESSSTLTIPSALSNNSESKPSSSENLKYSSLDALNSEADETISSAIDTSQSRYFQKNPNVFANAKGKSLNLFAEEAVGLPSGWKMRSIEREGKEGVKITSIKHYLTLDQKVLKTGLAVIEYLRLEGKLSPDQLLEVRTILKISDKKLRDLYE